jgi:hypothetical protein
MHFDHGMVLFRLYTSHKLVLARLFHGHIVAKLRLGCGPIDFAFSSVHAIRCSMKTKIGQSATA